MILREDTFRREDILRELELLPVWRPRNVRARPEGRLEKTEPSLVSPVLVTPIVESITAKQATDTKSINVDELSAENTRPLMDDAVVLLDRAEMIQKMDWQKLQDCVKDCQACGLAVTRTQTIFGVGDPNAEWLIVGEAPGTEEDAGGEPFVGEAGKLLDNMLTAMQLRRGQNVYLANVLKCRPPENRDPQDEEIRQCDLYLKQQLALIKPKLIIALGQVAAQSLLQMNAAIVDMRGQVHGYQGVPVIVTYHPAYLLSKPEDKPQAWEDLCFALKTMRSL